jgi:hypothetical protein
MNALVACHVLVTGDGSARRAREAPEQNENEHARGILA